MKESGERMPGFGHRYHTKDPRTARLFELAREAGVDGEHMKAARAVEKAFATMQRKLCPLMWTVRSAPSLPIWE